MKRAVLGVCILAVVCSIAFLVLRGRSAKAAPAPPPLNIVSSQSFPFELLRNLVSQRPTENTAISPVSLSFALGMLSNGARGKTQEGILTALGSKGRSVDELNRNSADLMSNLTSQSSVTLTIANSLWAKKGTQLDSGFVDTCARSYQASVQELDFGDPSSADRINAWAKAKTNGLIKSAISSTNAMTESILINTVYFKAAWQQPFEQRKTLVDDFHPATGDTVRVPMMGGEEDREYLEGAGFQAVKLPYGDGRFAMFVFLPSKKLGMPGFLAKLDGAHFAIWSTKFSSQPILLRMPKFRMDCAVDSELKKALSGMGMSDAFSEAHADLTGMAPRGTWVDLAIHEVVVDVNEERTEAAAATVVATAAGTIAWQKPPPSMIVDRPFVFVIWDDKTKSCLFAAVVNDPTK